MSLRSAPLRPAGARACRIAAAVAAAGDGLLARAGRELMASLDAEEIASALAALVVPGLADACAVDVVDADGQVRRVYATAADGTTDVLLDENPDPEAAAGACRLVLALAVDDEAGGTLTLARAAGHPFSARDRALAEALAGTASLALHNARRYARAREATRMRDEVLGVVAHDLRNPLMALSMYAHLLQEAGLSAEQEAWTSNLLRGVEQMNRLIQDLLDASALDEGRLRVEPLPVAVEPLLREAARLLERQAEERGLRLSWSAAPGLPAGLADHDRMLQVLSNLLGNAVKFSPPGAEVELRAEPQGDEVVFTVRDGGRGIAAEDLPRIFDRFWQGAASRGGAGLGLAITRGIVESHGGHIRVESTLGAGSTFTVSIPASADAPAEPVEAPEDAGRRERIRVLVVDDHPAIRRGLRELLRRRPGLTLVGEAATAEEAVERTAALAPDVVLMDLNLPGGGLDATRRIAREHPDAHVLILTADPDDGRVGAALEAGARGYLRKSTDPASLVSAIRTVRGSTLVLDAGLRAWATGTPSASAVPKPEVPAADALRVLALEAAGYGTAEIAVRLELPRRAVQLHRAQGMRALGLATRAELVRHALREGWLAADRDGGATGQMDPSPREKTPCVTDSGMPAGRGH
jgi:signal transduction histidine kinase/DNA-binding NarL/FixJ family response regulator